MIEAYKELIEIRRKVFTEIARIAYQNKSIMEIEKLPEIIIPGSVAKYRKTIELERNIVAERLRLALNIDSENNHLINIIPIACNTCPMTSYKVTDICEGCLAKPCVNSCPKKAISIVDGKSTIDQEKCILCGKCADVCPFSAIVKRVRPCEKSCGMQAIQSGLDKIAKIDYEKCVACGRCAVNCPFGAIADRSEIYACIKGMQSKPVIAMIAPSFLGQFGDKVNAETIVDCLKQLGFSDVIEVAVGADLCTKLEAAEFVEKVGVTQPLMATSCCPAWVKMVKKNFPDLAKYISHTETPMILTSKIIKETNKDALIAFIGPCSAKKEEAKENSGYVDFVLTYEELYGMIIAKEIELSSLKCKPFLQTSTKAGRGFAVSEGLLKAITNQIYENNNNKQIPTTIAEGLHQCRKTLMLAKVGKLDGYLLEGMGCPGGCVSGAGTVEASDKATRLVNKYVDSKK